MLIQVVGPVELQHLPQPRAALALSGRRRDVGSMTPKLGIGCTGAEGGSCGTHRYAALRLESLRRLRWRVRFMDGGRFPGVSMNWATREEKKGQVQAFPAMILGVLCPHRCVLGYPIPPRADLAFV